MMNDLRERVALVLGWRQEKMPHGLVSWLNPQGQQYAAPPELTMNFMVSILHTLWHMEVVMATGDVRAVVLQDGISYPAYSQDPVEALAMAYLAAKAGARQGRAEERMRNALNRICAVYYTIPDPREGFDKVYEIATKVMRELGYKEEPVENV